MLDNKLAYLACIIVMALGLMVFSSMNTLTNNLNEAKDHFYDNYHMADVFISVRSMSENRVKDLETIEGIERAQGRLKIDVTVLNDKSTDKKITMRLNTYDVNQSYHLNDVYIARGYTFKATDYAIWLDEDYLEAHHLKVGDLIQLRINGRRVNFSVAGGVRSPEYVYATQNAFDLFPSPETFGIGYVSKQVLQTLTAKENQVTDISLQLSKGTDYETVKPLIESQLDGYGIIAMSDLEHQTSHMILSEELKGVEGAAQSIPFLFLGIACFILYIMLKRLTEAQRGQIGILKAQGFSNYQILWHYILYALIIGILSALLGGLLGLQLTQSLTVLYQEFFSFPTLSSTRSYDYVLYGLILSIVFSAFAGFQGGKKILQLTPSMAMTPEAPEKVSHSWLEKFPWLWSGFNMQGKMALRNIARSKGRSIFTVVGLVFAFSLMVVTWSYNSMVDRMIFDQYNKVQLYDMKVVFTSPIEANEAKQNLLAIEGTQVVESIMECPATLMFHGEDKGTLIIATEDKSYLYRVIDGHQRRIFIEGEGLYLSENLAMALHAKEGDIIRLESPYFKNDYEKVPIVKIMPQYIGSNGYVSQSLMNQWIGGQPLATGALIQSDPLTTKDLVKTLEDAPKVGNVELKAQTLEKYTDVLASYSSMIYILALVSIIVGFAIIYNSSIISLSERQREMASMRVLGMSIHEVLEIISVEQWLLAIVSIVLGIPVTMLMMQGLKYSYTNELYSVPSNIGASAFILSVFGTFLFVYLSQINVKRKLRQMAIVEVLKERE